MKKEVYKHVSGREGFLEKRYHPTGGVPTIMIKMICGSKYYAPSHEFKLLS